MDVAGCSEFDLVNYVDPTLQCQLVGMNDIDKRPFPQIADWIETNIA